MIGHRLTLFLLEAGASVFVLDNFSRGQKYIQGAEYSEFPYDDATNLGSCMRAFDGAYAIFNLAASVGGVYHNLSHQAQMFESNIRLQTTPVIAAAQTKPAIFFQTSSVCIYARGFNNPAREVMGHYDFPEEANAGYAWAKRLGERVCSWAFAGTDTKYVIGRPTNAYGVRDYFDERAHVIPALVKKFLTQEVVEVYGGQQTREFIYSDDVARGVMVVAERGGPGEAYNLGTDGRTVISIAELAAMLKRLTDSRAEISFVQDRPTGDQHRRTDSAKAQNLGWKYLVGLEQGLEHLIAWYKKEGDA